MYITVIISDGHIKDSGPELHISSMLYSRDTPFWSQTFDMFHLRVTTLDGSVSNSNNVGGVIYLTKTALDVCV